MHACMYISPHITGSFDSHEGEIIELEASLKVLQNDMQKLNALIAKNNKLQSLLVEGNLDLENEFHSQLKVCNTRTIYG